MVDELRVPIVEALNCAVNLWGYPGVSSCAAFPPVERRPDLSYHINGYYPRTVHRRTYKAMYLE